MPKQPIPYFPVGGISYGECPQRIGDTQVQNARNWCFDGRRAWTRPGLRTNTLTGTGLSTVRMVGSFLVDGVPYTFLITTTNKFFSVDLNGAATEITGAGFTMATSGVNKDSWALINAELIVGNSTSGLIRWVPGAAGYTLVSGTNYAFLTSHFSRGVAAYNISSSARGIAWSVPGNNADWSTTIDGAGSLILTDAPDDITGLGNIRNTLIVARRHGFHLGYSTGVAQPAFRFELHSIRDVGCFWAGSMAQSSDLVFFVGQDNVYSFDTTRVVPIGDDIRALLFENMELTLAKSGQPYLKLLGFMSRRNQSGEPPRATYNIVTVPATTTTSNWPLRHFVLDIEKSTWECHEYGKQWNYGWASIPNYTGASISFVDQSTSPSFYTWDSDVACEREAILHGRNITIGAESDDVTLDQAIMKFQDRGPAQGTLMVRCDLNETEIETLVAFQAGTPSRRGKWSRKNIGGLRQTGQGWEWILKTQPGSSLGVSDIVGMFSLSGQFRGE